MKTRFLDYKKAILSAISAVNLLAMVGIFAFTWYNFYLLQIGAPFYYRYGNWLFFFIYAFVLYAITSVLGGYRIGIRSPSGAYFYYAHLAEYAKEFEVGETVLAGTHLGYMGDTGYSDIPGTTGNFPVHLHFGIYINDENGQELSVNPYPMVLYLWEQQGKYTFGETKRQ